MRFCSLGCATLSLTFALSSLADEPAAKTPREELDALVKAQRDAQNEFSRAYQAAKTDEERQQVSQELGSRSSAQSWSSDFLKFIDKHQSDDAAADALKWLLLHDPSSTPTSIAIGRVSDEVLKSEQMLELCGVLENRSGAAADYLLSKIIAVSPHRSVQGRARFAQAMQLKRGLDTSRMPAVLEAKYKERIEKDKLRRIEQIEAILQTVINDYGQVEHYSGSLKNAAEGMLFEVKHLGIGCLAPEIVGQDLDGRPLKLSDFRGKVVLLDFWGTWCGPCMAELPEHQKRLERYQGQPLAIVGIDKDDDRDEVKKVLAEKGITWPSWFDGTQTPITNRWNIHGWPTLYLIDAQGVIRHKGDILRSSSARKNAQGQFESFKFLDDYIAELVKEAEQPAKNATP